MLLIKHIGNIINTAVECAFFGDSLNINLINGTTNMPPPAPKKPLTKPTNIPAPIAPNICFFDNFLSIIKFIMAYKTYKYLLHSNFDKILIKTNLGLTFIFIYNNYKKVLIFFRIYIKMLFVTKNKKVNYEID